MADNKPQFLKTCNAEAAKPDLKRLYGRRYRLIRYFDIFQGVSIGAAEKGLFADYGTNDIGHTQGIEDLADLRLMDVSTVDAPDGRAGPEGKKLLRAIYETLTEQLVDEEPPVTDYDLNGLKRVTHKLIGLPGIDLEEYDFEVGVSVYAADGDLILAQVKDTSTDAATRVTVVYLEPGVLKKSRSPGPIHGSVQHDWETWLLDATNESEMGPGGTIPGVVTADSDSDYEGYKTRRFTSVAAVTGSLTGVKYTYADTYEVQTPGTVELITRSVTAGDLEGTVAVPKVTPPGTKTVACTVSVEITTNPAGMSGTPAYDLNGISCSVDATQASYNYNGFDSLSTTSSETNVMTRTAARRSASIGARVAHYPGHYLVAQGEADPKGPVTGTFSYVGGEQLSLSEDGSIVSGEAMTNTDVNTLTGTGSTSATGYSTTGILARSKPRAVLQTLAGVTYYEVVTWSVA